MNKKMPCLWFSMDEENGCGIGNAATSLPSLWKELSRQEKTFPETRRALAGICLAAGYDKASCRAIRSLRQLGSQRTSRL